MMRTAFATGVAAFCILPNLAVGETLVSDWMFTLTETNGTVHPRRAVTVPHDWAVESAFDPVRWDNGCGALPYFGRGVYETTLDPAEDSWLEFGGVMSHATVRIDGAVVAERAYGYSSFRVPVPKGRHGIAVTAEPRPESSRWYPGAGIYRPVRLVPRRPGDVLPEDVALTFPEVTSARAVVRVTWPGGEKEIVVGNPVLWSPETPHLYTLDFGGRTYRYGIRTLRFDPAKGFFLNGRHRQMKGVCLHHDLGALGAAFDVTAARRQLRLLKEMGCDAIRTSHNPPAPELLDLCDEMGFLVLDEAFDGWRLPQGGANGYWRDFDRCHVRDLADFVRRDRNHPCVVMWSVGNEVAEHKSEELAAQGAALGRELTAIVRANDPQGRPTTAGCFKRCALWSGFADGVDVFGANYLPDDYGFFLTNGAPKGIVGTETCSCVSSRGEYFFPVVAGPSPRDRRVDLVKMIRGAQVSGYDLWGPHSNDYPPDREFAAQDRNPHVYGEFVWTGFDYLGEPDPCRELERPGRSSYFGIFDLCGFPKDRYWLYLSKWRPDVPCAHILPHWTWPGREGEVTPVHVYTSGDEAELFVNGVSQGRKRRGPSEYRFRWDDVRYRPGEVRVRVRKGGRDWAEDRVVTAGAPARLAVTAENADDPLVYVRIEVRDAQGNLVPRAANRLAFEVTGDLSLAGVCNGDAADYDSLKGRTLCAFNGLCQALVRRRGPCGGRLTVRSEGLPDAGVEIAGPGCALPGR